MTDGGVPEGSFSVVNFCQILYATTSGQKIGANGTAWLWAVTPISWPWSSPFPSDSTKFGLLTEGLLTAAVPKLCGLAEHQKQFPDYPEQSVCRSTWKCCLKLLLHHHPLNYPCYLYPSERSLCCWWWTTQFHPSGKSLVFDGRQIDQSCQLTPGRSSGPGKAT